MPAVRMTHEAAGEYLALPLSVADEFDRIKVFLARNPLHLPPWVDVKLMGNEKGKKVFRLRVGEYRAIFTFDGEVGKFTRFRPRRSVEYGRLPKG